MAKLKDLLNENSFSLVGGVVSTPAIGAGTNTDLTDIVEDIYGKSEKVTAKDVELLNTLRNDTRTWQNDMAKLRAIFDEGCDTRPKLVERYKVWGV